jgi:hypothetical protein
MNTVNKKSVDCKTANPGSFLEMQSQKEKKRTSVLKNIETEGRKVERKLTPGGLTLTVDDFAFCKKEMFNSVFTDESKKKKNWKTVIKGYNTAEFDCCKKKKNGECIVLTDFCRCLQEFESFGREESLGKTGRDITLTFETFDNKKGFGFVRKEVVRRFELKYQNHQVSFEVDPPFKDKTKRRRLLGRSESLVNNGEVCGRSSGRRRRLLHRGRGGC